MGKEKSVRMGESRNCLLVLLPQLPSLLSDGNVLQSIILAPLEVLYSMAGGPFLFILFLIQLKETHNPI